MAEEEAKKVEPEPRSEPPPAAAPPVAEPPLDSPKDKALVPLPPPEDDCKALAIIEKEPEVKEEKKPEGSLNRGIEITLIALMLFFVMLNLIYIFIHRFSNIFVDAVLARVATEKKLSLIKAWEESEKSKAENKAQKKISSVGAWENSKNATLEAELKKMEEQLEKKKAKYIEKTKNKMALIHKSAEEKRAAIEAQRGEDLLKAEEVAAKYRATGTGPKKLLGCF